MAVITSAAILLAAVFAVLGVLAMITLTELGIIVWFGVLLDTLLVRTVLVPALVVVLGRRFWWPGAPSRRDTKPARHAPSRRREPHRASGTLLEKADAESSYSSPKKFSSAPYHCPGCR